MAVDREKSFWLSYSDLMTSLFFIMLVLFIVSVISVFKLKEELNKLTSGNKPYNELLAENEKLRKENKQLSDTLGATQATAEQYKNILQLEEQFKVLSSSSTLRYDNEHKTFVAKELEGIEIFSAESDTIKSAYYGKVDSVGHDLEKLLSELYRKNSTFKFLLVIEGNSANNYKHTMSKDKPYNYRLSYDRALALYNRWNKQGINLRKYNTEIQICGSGLNGINRDTQVEEYNKRFVIQIIPKISKPK